MTMTRAKEDDGAKKSSEVSNPNSPVERDRQRVLRAEHAWRLRIVLATIPTVLMMLLIFVRVAVPGEELRYAMRDSFVLFILFTPENFAVIVFALALTGLGGFLMLYLQTGFRKDYTSTYTLTEHRSSEPQSNIMRTSTEPDEKVGSGIAELSLRMDVLESKYMSTRVVVDEDDRRKLVEDLAQRVESDSSNQVIAGIKRQLFMESLESDVESTTLHRLGRELDALSFRGNLNLTLGVIITVAGIGFLIHFVLYRQVPVNGQTSPLWYLAQYFPRLSLIILIEIFAYFFLRLYKSSLAEIKYFQNEMTNVESRTLALRAARASEDKETLAKILLRIAETERNYMKKDETTVDLELAKTDREQSAGFAKQVADLLSIKTSQSG